MSLICIPRFPSILNKYFPKLELGLEIIIYNSNYKENVSDSFIYLMENHPQPNNSEYLTIKVKLSLIFSKVLSN